MEIQAKIMERVESNRGRQIGIDPKKKAIALVVWFVVLIGLMVSCSMVQNAQRKPLTSLISTQNIKEVVLSIQLHDNTVRYYQLSDEEIEDFKSMLERTSYIEVCENDVYKDSWSAMIKDWEYTISYESNSVKSVVREKKYSYIFAPAWVHNYPKCGCSSHVTVLVSGLGNAKAHKPPKSLGSSWDSIDLAKFSNIMG